jgi:hypothetical protein
MDSVNLNNFGIHLRIRGFPPTQIEIHFIHGFIQARNLTFIPAEVGFTSSMDSVNLNNFGIHLGIRGFRPTQVEIHFIHRFIQVRDFDFHPSGGGIHFIHGCMNSKTAGIQAREVLRVSCRVSF